MSVRPTEQSLLISAAEAMGVAIGEAAPELIGASFNIDLLIQTSSNNSPERLERDLPSIIGAIRLDDTPVLIGTLQIKSIIPIPKGDALDTNNLPTSASERHFESLVDDLLRRYRNQATIARSWLGKEASNLQLFLIVPLDNLNASNWRHLAAKIEADDRVCRKLVWLYQGPPTIEQASSFLERTFVAQPWISQSDGENDVELDGISKISLPAGWEALVDDQDLDHNDLVQQLISLEGRPH